MEPTFESLSMLPLNESQQIKVTPERTLQTSPNRTPFPAEIELRILKFAILPKSHCVLFYFGQCFDQWNCPLEHPIPFNRRETSRLPPPSLMLVSKTWRCEALKYFFANHMFIFNTNPYLSGALAIFNGFPREGMDLGWPGLRDPHATRLLDFVDKPEWKNRGSRLWVHKFECLAEDIDRYRCRIRKLALIYRPHPDRASTMPEDSDWDWVLKVDWKTLPDLEELYLDFSGIKDLAQWTHDPIPDIEECVERMSGLRLKKLVLGNVPPHLVGQENTTFVTLWGETMSEEGEIMLLMDDSREW